VVEEEEYAMLEAEVVELEDISLPLGALVVDKFR
tara:strand:- start:283 stop:384 length:102 start_codon:yes stop_codon:yes gene_type:complete